MLHECEWLKEGKLDMQFSNLIELHIIENVILISYNMSLISLGTKTVAKLTTVQYIITYYTYYLESENYNRVGAS